jgi:antitoxin HicB
VPDTCYNILREKGELYMNDNFTYAAILDYSEKGYINIIFPDFSGYVTGVEVGEDYIVEAQDCLALAISDYESKKKDLPKCSLADEIKLEQDQKLVYINVWMPFHRTKIKEIYVKKTLTIPNWLDILAKNNNINFSAVLVEALKEKLEIN